MHKNNKKPPLQSKGGFRLSKKAQNKSREQKTDQE